MSLDAQLSIGNNTIQFSDFRLVDQFPPPKINGNAAIYFSLHINKNAIADQLVQAGVSRDAIDFQDKLARAHSYAQHIVAEYLNNEMAPGFRAYGNLEAYVVLNSDIVLPLLELADKSGLKVSEENAGHFKDRKGLYRGSLAKAPANLQALSNDLAAAIQLGVEDYAKNPHTVLAEAEERFAGVVPGNGRLFTTEQRGRVAGTRGPASAV